jgi:hypothetical protein
VWNADDSGNVSSGICFRGSCIDHYYSRNLVCDVVVDDGSVSNDNLERKWSWAAWGSAAGGVRTFEAFDGANSSSGLTLWLDCGRMIFYLFVV